jgi:hypothetical protein
MISDETDVESLLEKWKVDPKMGLSMAEAASRYDSQPFLFLFQDK